MIVLADSNILTALAQQHGTQYLEIRRTLTVLRGRGDRLCLVPQNFIEFWAVATRPITSNGLGLGVDKSSMEVTKFKRYFGFLDDVSDIFAHWEMLVAKYNIVGRNVHDTRLVAAMLQHGLSHLLTFNVKDFKRFDEITVIDPTCVI